MLQVSNYNKDGTFTREALEDGWVQRKPIDYRAVTLKYNGRVNGKKEYQASIVEERTGRVLRCVKGSLTSARGAYNLFVTIVSNSVNEMGNNYEVVSC